MVRTLCCAVATILAGCSGPREVEVAKAQACRRLAPDGRSVGLVSNRHRDFAIMRLDLGLLIGIAR